MWISGGIDWQCAGKCTPTWLKDKEFKNKYDYHSTIIVSSLTETVFPKKYDGQIYWGCHLVIKIDWSAFIFPKIGFSKAIVPVDRGMCDQCASSRGKDHQFDVKGEGSLPCF